MLRVRLRSPIFWLLIQALLAQLVVQSVAMVHDFAHAPEPVRAETRAEHRDSPGQIEPIHQAIHSLPDDCRHGTTHNEDCGDDLIHFLAHIGHCCHLVGISSSLTVADIVPAQGTRFVARDPVKASLSAPRLFRPPILN